METKRMTIGLYNPYYDGFGGGERYTLTLAAHWSRIHDVAVFWDDPDIIGQSEKRFGIDLSRVRIAPNVFANGNIFEKLAVSRKFDLIFFLSDGSIPMSLARHNILHFQIPFASVLADPWKMGRFDAVVCNSAFTRRELDPQIGQRATVIYPPVQHIGAGNGPRRKRIVSVGRFSGAYQAKKQEIMIDAFIDGVKCGKLDGWELVLAGGLMDSDREYFRALTEHAHGFRITLLPNIGNTDLIRLYRSSRLYWHAAGYGVTDPAHMEHFGITTAEAMSAGLVPLVYAAGGQTEIVTDNADGFVWKTKEELIDKTRLISGDQKLYARMSAAAAERAEDFSVSRFTRAFDALISGFR